MPSTRATTPFETLKSATAEVCPKTPDANAPIRLAPPSGAAPSQPTKPENLPKSASEWARQNLNFQPSPKQAEVLDSDAKYLILCCNRQWGKTTTMAVKTLHAALMTPKTKIVIIARSKEQAGILIENATEFAMILGLPIRRVLGQSFSLKLPNESRICAVPHTQDTSLGRTANILVVDEAAAVKDAVYYSVSPFVARTHGQIWLLSTPTRQTGFFYEFWHDPKQRWHRVFSTVEECPDIDKEFLEMQREADPTRYRQDFLCEFIQPANRLVSREFVRSILRKKKD